jgi:hypothetical protein
MRATRGAVAGVIFVVSGGVGVINSPVGLTVSVSAALAALPFLVIPQDLWRAWAPLGPHLAHGRDADDLVELMRGCLP